MNYELFAKEWIEVWNTHDLERILNLYSEGIEVSSPKIKTYLNTEKSYLKGKQTVRDYWFIGLQKNPNLHFKLIDFALGINSIAIYYQSINQQVAIEVMFFDPKGKVNKMIAHYR